MLIDTQLCLTLCIFVYQYTWWYMTLGRCPLSIFCSPGTPPRATSANQPHLSLSLVLTDSVLIYTLSVFCLLTRLVGCSRTAGGVTPNLIHHRRAKMVRIRQSRLDSGLSFQAKVLNTYQVVLSPFGSGPGSSSAYSYGLSNLVRPGCFPLQNKRGCTTNLACQLKPSLST